MRTLTALLVSLITAWAHAQTFTDGNLSVSPYLGTGISDPIALRFTADDAGFLIEKGGAVKRFDGGAVSTVLSLSVATNSERGLLGMTLDPDYAQNGHVYLYYSAGSGSNTLFQFRYEPGRLVRRRRRDGRSVVEVDSVRVFGVGCLVCGFG